MKLATLIVLASVLVLYGCSFSIGEFIKADNTDMHTIKATKGDTIYELSGDLEGFQDFDEVHRLIDKLPKDQYVKFFSKNLLR